MNSTVAASSMPAPDSDRLAGSAPHHHDPSAASVSSSSAASVDSGRRPSGLHPAPGAIKAAKPPQPTQAAAWL